MFEAKPTLFGSLVMLRQFTSPDIDAMGSVLADPAVLRFTGSVRSTDAAHGADAVLDERTRRWYETRGVQGDRLDLAIIDLATCRCVGEAVFNDVRRDDDTASFRILIGPDGRDRGLGTEATCLMVDHAFATTSLHRIDLEVYAFNPRAQRAYEKAGFVVEGRLRSAFVFDGERIDTVVMAVLRPEWADGSVGAAREARAHLR